MTSIDYSIKDVEKVVKVDGVVKNVEVSRLTAPGENFISLVLRVDLDVEKDGQTTKVSTVAKRVPLANSRMISMSFQSMKNEIKFYSEIIPILTRFSNEYGIDSESLYAKYYGSRLNLEGADEEVTRDAVLLVENLIPQGYRNEDRYIGFDIVTAKALLKSLALFHAIPMALREKDPERFKTIKDFLITSMPKFPPGGPGSRGPPGPPGVPDGEPGTEDPAKRPPGFPNFPEGQRPDQLILKAMQDIPACAPYLDRLKVMTEKPSMGPGFGKVGVEPWATISHSDFWVNNMMVKPREGEEPLVKLVDFQVCGYKSFACDLVFFLLTSVSNDVIKESLDELLKFYYTALTENLRRFDVNLDLTYDIFLKELEEAGQESETKHALFFCNVVFGEKNSSVDVAVQEVDMMARMGRMIEKMSPLAKDKLALIASVVSKRNWV
ncbi:hypothetical protein GWI33_002712 [Rhynchophorus ferrugineus]|uniref:CHK kinase-like domain-containing protein n=1 Tax=Rhynchophorus ferrugineus TaxID=354439 RepID=A0A834IRJ4_RHYFE|nr:hypothetical protein GWI33_002712 [Rhynchophorus ferrugineus]